MSAVLMHKNVFFYDCYIYKHIFVQPGNVCAALVQFPENRLKRTFFLNERKKLKLKIFVFP